MKVMVNGETKELEYVTASGCDVSQEVVGSYESLKFDKGGNVIMTHDQYDWWTTEIEKLVKIDDLLVEISFDGKDYYQYANETNGCDLETQTNMQLAWLKEYQSNH